MSRLAYAARVVALGLLVAGCATDYPRKISLDRDYRVERLPKRGTDYALLFGDWVHVEGRGVLRLYRERPDDLLVLLPLDPGAPTKPWKAPPLEPIRPADTPSLTLTALDTGLPRSGQWRERFDLAPIDAQPGVEIVTTTPRKSGGGPRIFGFQSSEGWKHVAWQVPWRRYDYGSAAVGDFDGNDRQDLALAMHGTGFAALLDLGPATTESSTGLPFTGGVPNGSGRTLAVNRQPDGDRLLTLREPMSNSPGLGLREYILRNGRWQATEFSVADAVGERMEISRSTRCDSRLAIADARRNAPRVWTQRQGRWSEEAFDLFPAAWARVVDLAWGDFDGNGCDDLAVTYVARESGTWYGSVDLYLAGRSGRWQRHQVWRDAAGSRPSAVGFVSHEKRDLLIVLDDTGDLHLIGGKAEAAQRLRHEPAPDWRHGCRGVAVAGGDIDGDGQEEIVAAFSGEPTSLDLRRCKNGGALQAWRIGK